MTRGPIPKREDQRRRRNKSETPTTRVTPPAAPVEQPPLGFPTHPIAEAWYASLAESGQALYYEPSDWQAARLVAFDLTRHLNARRVSSQMLAALWVAMGDLLTTEAARRRVRMEIDRSTGAAEDEAAKAKVAVLDDYRRSVEA
jgi:hypothetical protein